ncbi:MAG: hypothetical protein WCF26_11330 [Candidatus Sulfotelmatobacter sp.]
MDERASPKLRDLVGWPPERSAFCTANLPSTPTPQWDQEVCARRIKQILRRVGLTMNDVSVLTSVRFGKKTPYFIPPTFLFRHSRGTTPHICQIVALSQITGFRFADWMNLFGFDLKLIFALQLKLHTERTAMVTPSPFVPAPDAFVAHCSSGYPIENDERYLFAKIGSQDAVIYPRILPGSIVRADRHYSRRVIDEIDGEVPVWLVEHPSGLTCCYVKHVDNRHVILLPNRPPLSAWPLCLSSEVRILGLVDLEFRPRTSAPVRPMCRARKSEFPPGLAYSLGTGVNLSALLRRSRARSGLTLRAVHEMTVQIARLLGNQEYGVALGLLSDYEAINKVPRHVAKIMTLCIIYGLHLCELLKAGGIHIDDSDKVPLDPYDGKRDLPLAFDVGVNGRESFAARY